MYENELTGTGGQANKPMGVVSSTTYASAQALTQGKAMSKVTQDSLASHRNSHR